MTPQEAIAGLDRALSDCGQTVTLRRGVGGATATMRGFVRGYDIEKIVGLITLADRRVIISPTGLGALGLPRGGDDFSTNGRLGKIQDDVNPIYVNDVLVRVEMRVRFA